MSIAASGKVLKIGTRSGAGRRGPWTAYSVQLDGTGPAADGWYSAGFEAPAVKEGEYVDLTVRPGKKEGYYDIETLAVKAPPAKVKEEPKASTKPQQTAAKASYSEPTTQESISYQAARNAANVTVATLLAHGGLKLPAKAADIFAVITAAVDKLTVQYFHDTRTFRLFDTVEDAGAEPDISPGNTDAKSASEEP